MKIYGEIIPSGNQQPFSKLRRMPAFVDGRGAVGRGGIMGVIVARLTGFVDSLASYPLFFFVQQHGSVSADCRDMDRCVRK